MGSKFRVLIHIEKPGGQHAEIAADVWCWVGAHMIGQKEGRVLSTETPDCPLFGLEPSPYHDPALCLHCQKKAADPDGFGKQLRWIDAEISALRERTR